MNNSFQAIPPTIQGLTLLRPWPYAFLHGDVPKRIENRSWRPGASSDWIALHAGKGFSKDDIRFLLQHFPNMPTDKKSHAESQIFAVCRLQKVYEYTRDFKSIPYNQMPWSFGPYCWWLHDFVALKTPVECSGAQGLWPISKPLLSRIQASYEEALGGKPTKESLDKWTNEHVNTLFEGMKDV